LGKFIFPGINVEYKSAQHTDYGWSGLAKQGDSLLPHASLMTGIIKTTGNDFNENTGMDRSPTVVANGFSYIPTLGSGYVLGANTPIAILDKSGINKFFTKWISAIRTKRQSIVSTAADEIYVCQPRHFRAASPNSTIPSEFAPYSAYINSTYWNATRYATAPAWVSNGALIPDFDKIRVAAFLSEPGEIEINGTASSTMGPGLVYYEVALAVGTPTIKIKRGGSDIVTVSGMPVNDNGSTHPVYPGGYDFNYLKLF